MREALHTAEVPGDHAPSLVLRPAQEPDWPAIMAIEDASYEPGRRDSETYLRRGAATGLGLVALDPDTGEILGFCFGGPIEAYADVPGPAGDERQGRGDTFFAADCTVAPAARGRGVGRRLKHAQLAWCRERGFLFVTGRNRLGKAGPMQAINRSLGAVAIALIDRGEGIDEYYQIALAALPDPRPA